MSKKITVSKRLEFDAGHRLPNHKSKCRNLHGHHYTIELTFEGEINTTEGDSSQGMIIDFSDIKEICKKNLIDVWDHAFIVYENDKSLVEYLSTIEDHKTVIVEQPPTAEFLARKAHDIISAGVSERFGDSIKISKLRLYETPTSWADAY